jgi:hypothetical protein
MHALKIMLIVEWPAVRIYRAAGAWVSATPGARRARWFDGLVAV